MFVCHVSQRLGKSGTPDITRKEEAPLEPVRLFEERGETSRFIDATVDEKGDVLVSAQDVGKDPQEWWGDSDYEFWVTVHAQHKDRLLLALIEKLYGGRFHAVDEFRDFVKSRGIPFEWGSWI